MTAVFVFSQDDVSSAHSKLAIMVTRALCSLIHSVSQRHVTGSSPHDNVNDANPT
jgi:hypothetical protein